MLMIPGLNKNVENDRKRDCGLVDNDKHETSDICGEEENMKENSKTKTRRIKEKSEKSWLTKRFETLNNCQRGPIFVASAVVVARSPDVSIQYINYANDSCFSHVCVARLVKDFIDESHIKKRVSRPQRELV